MTLPATVTSSSGGVYQVTALPPAASLNWVVTRGGVTGPEKVFLV